MPSDPEVAPDLATSANAAPATPPVEGSPAPKGEDALRMPVPGIRPAPAPGPSVDLASVRPLLGSAVPAPAPRGRSINLGEILDQFGGLLRRIEKLEADQAGAIRAVRQQVDGAVERLKRQMDNFVEAAERHAEDRAREVGEKVDARYAGEFARLNQGLETIANACKAMTEAHQLIQAVGNEAAKAARGASTMAAKIDILAKTVDEVRSELGSDIDAVQSQGKAATDKAQADAEAALKGVKALQNVEGRVATLENWRKNLAQKGTGGR